MAFVLFTKKVSSGRFAKPNTHTSTRNRWHCIENDNGSLTLSNSTTNKHIWINPHCSQYGCQGGKCCFRILKDIELYRMPMAISIPTVGC